MPVALYDIVVPAFLSGLASLTLILEKAEAYAQKNGIPESEFMSASLWPDMKPFPFHVETCVNFVKIVASDFEHTRKIKLDEYPTTFAGLHERVKEAIAEATAIVVDKVNVLEDRELVITSPSGSRTSKFEGADSILKYTLPNFYFHLGVAYNTLRAKGVPVGKQDFISPPQ